MTLLLASCEPGLSFLSSFPRAFPLPQVACSHVFINWLLSEHLWRSLCRPLESSLYVTPLSVVYPVSFSHLAQSQFPITFPQLREAAEVLWVHFLTSWSGNFHQAVKWVICRAHLLCFPSLKDLCPSLTYVQYFGKDCFTLLSGCFFGYQVGGVAVPLPA